MAVKVFRLDVIPETSARLAEVLKRMASAPVKHPAVVDILDAGLEGTTAFLAMEYVAAETLDVALRQLAPARLAIALPILRQVAEALEAGWAAGMGHGALHPRDIFVVPASSETAPPRIVVRVSGLGIADAMEELDIPTPVRRPYTAPEREQPAPWDIRADVYSLGVIAYELLTGRRPTDAADLDAELPDGTPPEDEAAIWHAIADVLAIDPEARFATPMAFVEALRADPAPHKQAESPLLPFVEEAADSDVEAEVAGGSASAEPGPGSEPEPIWIPEADSDFAPGPESDLEPASEPERARSHVAPPAFPAVPAPSDRRTQFQPFVEPPKESDMPRILGVAAIMLVIGAGFGYWLRGPGPALAPDVPAVTPTAITHVPEEPIGTEVAVNPAKPSPSPTPDVATPQPVTRAAAPAAAPARARTRKTEPVATTGSVRVETRPAGATVVIDGRTVGRTPVQTADLKPGSHSVRVSLAGHRTVTTTTVVRAGQQTLLRLSLESQ